MGKATVIPILLLFLLFFCAVPEAILQNEKSCSKYPAMPCEVAEFNIIRNENSSIDWRDLKPKLWAFVAIKTDPKTLNLALRTSIRWLLPYTYDPIKLPAPLEGFLIRVTPKLNISDPSGPTKTYLAKLGRPIHTLSENYSSIEFNVDSTNIFDFDTDYKVEISFYPEGLNGRNEIENEAFRSPSKNDVCGKETKDVARKWVPTFVELIAHEVTAEVEVSFYPAPKSLCINHYSLYIQSIKTAQILGYAMLNSTGKEKELRYVFKNMPREEKLMIKLLAAQPKNKPCICTDCHCITIKSDIFTIPQITYKELPNPTLPAISKNAVNKNGHLIFLTLLILFGLFLSLFILFLLVRFLVKKNRLLKKSVNILSINQNDQKPIIDFHEDCTYKYLILASPVNDIDINIVSHLANVIRNSQHTLLYDRLDTEQVDENVYRWYKNAISEADKILVVHCEASTQPLIHEDVMKDPFSMLSCKIADGSLSPLDKRVIHISLNRATPFVYSEIIYNIPRDIHLLSEILEIPLNQDWLSLEKSCDESNSRRRNSANSINSLPPLNHERGHGAKEEERDIIDAKEETFDSGMHSCNSQSTSSNDEMSTDSEERTSTSNSDSGVQITEPHTQNSRIPKNDQTKPLILNNYSFNFSQI